MEIQQLEDEDGQAEQRRDAILLKLLKTPPKQRPKRVRVKSPSKSASSATAEKREPSA